GPVAVLGDPHPGTGCDEGGGGRDVEGGQAAAAGAAGVDHVPGAIERQADHGLPERPHPPGHLTGRLALGPERHQEPCGLGVGGPAFHDDAERGLRVVGREVLPGEDLLEEYGERLGLRVGCGRYADGRRAGTGRRCTHFLRASEGESGRKVDKGVAPCQFPPGRGLAAFPVVAAAVTFRRMTERERAARRNPAAKYYATRRDGARRELDRLEARIRRVSNARFLSFLLAAAALVWAELRGPEERIIPLVTAGAAGAAFVALVVRHGRLKRQERRAAALW